MERIRPRHLLRFALQQKKHFWRNYLAHALEGGLFQGGMVFISWATVLPRMVQELNGPVWLVTLAPLLMMMGFQLPPLFLAHAIEKLRWVRPLVLLFCIFQRVVYLPAGLALIFLGQAHPTLALACVAMAPLLSGLAAGISALAWQELVAKTIPGNRRSSLAAVRNILMALIGLGAGVVVAYVLRRYPGTVGYGVLHLITFAFLSVSYLGFVVMKEPDLPARSDGQTPDLLSNFRAMPQLIGGDRRFRRYVVARCLMNGMFIAVPFLASHALEVLQRPREYVGYLESFRMIGMLPGNLLAAWLGDRIGGKSVGMGAIGLAIAVCLGSILADHQWQYVVLFMLYGAWESFNMVSSFTLNLEICPLAKRGTYLAVLFAVNLCSLLAISGTSTLVSWLGGGHFGLVAILASSTMAAAAVLLLGIRDPRHHPPG